MVFLLPENEPGNPPSPYDADHIEFGFANDSISMIRIQAG
jgi:hypothetical protein